ncbi:tetratricopeptide repeat protein [Rubritalea tangerina]
MESIVPYQRGVQALADHLPELAVERFAEAYKIKGLADAQNREILYRLTEAQVRANQPDQALVTLNSKFFKDHPEREFWIAQALAAQGNYREAISHFQKLDPKSIYSNDATLSLASLQLALGERDAAIANYLKAIDSEDPITKLKATTTLAEIYIEDGQLDKAKTLIQTIPEESKSSVLKLVLEAQLSLNSKQYQDAIAQFSAFFAEDEKLHPRLYQIALIGLADARMASGQTQEAILGLTSFIEEHQDSPILLPVFERLAQWTPRPIQPDSPFYQQLKKWADRDADSTIDFGLRLGADSIVTPLPTPASLNATSPYLKAIAHYYYAKFTSELGTPGSLNQALFEFSAFRLTSPLHPLFGASIFDTAKIQIQLKQRSQALSSLHTLADFARSQQISLAPEAKSQAGFIAGLLSVEAENYPDAIKAFELATQSNNKYLADAAKINLGLAALRGSNLAVFDAQQKKITDKELANQLSIERALWLAHQKHPQAREALNTFLLRNPQNPRAVDARIALASLCATQAPLDPLLSKALIDSVDPSTLKETQFTDFTRTRYLVAELQQDWPTAIETLDTYLQKFPNNPSSTEFNMRKGLALYRNGEHNKARQLLGKIALENPDSPLTTFCHYYAGMAARLEGTPQALKESVDLFQKVIDAKSPLSTEARIQQARVLLDINRTEEAKVSLNKVYQPKSNAPQQREIGILLASALHTQGAEDPGQYAKAVAIYDQLLANKTLPLSWSNQIHYMKGQTLESMDQDQQALDTYYQVINRENIDPEAPETQQEWKWFYQCSFKAIALLEKMQNYRAAVALSKKVASYGGPESESYQKRARALEMQHMIWEE